VVVVHSFRRFYQQQFFWSPSLFDKNVTWRHPNIAMSA
jgi:hypothetical protein